MGFWNSVERKARKKHNCIYCSKDIVVGEKYSRETGTSGGDFYDYCLCLRCRWLIDTFESESEYLENILSTINNYDLVCCPACGIYSIKGIEMSEDKMSAYCICDCGAEWSQDFRIQGIKELIKATT